MTGDQGDADGRDGGSTGIDVDALAAALGRAFGGTPGGRRVVARQARDLADAGLLARDRGAPLTAATVLDELADAPADVEDVPSRWNWWLGAMEAAYGGYAEFQVRRYSREE